VEMATNVVIRVSCAHIGLGLLYLLGVGDGGERRVEEQGHEEPFYGGT
jgi:hypothetical protein